MAIAHQGTGTRGAGTTTTTPTLSGGVAGRIALAGRTIKPSTATATVEAGWNQKVNVTGGTGSQGIDTGPQRIAIDARILYGSDSNPTFDQGSSPNATSSVVSIYSAAAGKLIAAQYTSGDDATHGAGRSATSGTVSLEVDDVIWVYVASDTDFNTGGWTGPTISVSAGAVGSTTQRLAPGGSTTGQDVGDAVYEATVTTAAASATITFATNADGQANCGPVGFAVLRESQMSYTHLLTSTSAETFGTGSHTTASFTPDANSLLVVCVSVSNAASGTDIQGNLSITDSAGLTYTSRVTNQENAATGVSSYCSRIYTAPVGGSPASMTLTFDCGAVNVFAYHYSVLCITGYDTGSPVGTSGSVDNNGTGALTLTLGAAPTSTSFVVGYLFSDVNAAGTTNSLPGPDFTEVSEAATSTPNQWVQSEIRTGSTSTSVEWTDTDAGTATTFYRNAVALEVKQGTPSGDVTVTPGVIARSFSVPASAISVGTAPATVALSFTSPAPAVSIAAAPAAVAQAFTLPALAVHVAATPAAISRAFTIPAVVASESTIVNPDAIVRSFTLPAPAVSVQASPSVIARSVALPQPAVSVGAAPALIARAFVLPVVTVDGGAAGDATVTPAVIARAFGIPQTAISVVAAPALITTVAALPQPLLVIGAGPAAIGGSLTIGPVALSVAAAPQTLVVALVFPGFFILTDNIPVPAGHQVVVDREYAVVIRSTHAVVVTGTSHTVEVT